MSVPGAWHWRLSLHVVRASDGTPVVGAFVLCDLGGEQRIGDESGDGLIMEGASNATIVPVYISALRSRHANSGTSIQAALTPAAPVTELRLALPDTQPSQVRVVDQQGAPIEGAWIEMEGRRHGFGTDWASWKEGSHSDASGFASFLDVDGQLVDGVSAVHERYYGADVTAPACHEVGSASGLTIVLEKAALARGVVHDQAGRPVAGAIFEVQCQISLDGFPAQTTVRCTESSAADGSFEIPVRALAGETVKITVTAPGFQPSSMGPMKMPPSLELKGVEIHLIPGAYLRGVITDRHGTRLNGKLMISPAVPGGGAAGREIPVDLSGEFFADSLEPGQVYQIDAWLRRVPPGEGSLTPVDLGTRKPETNTLRLSIDFPE